MLISLTGEIDLNPGPKPSSFKCFSICQRNSENIKTHDILKIKLLAV